MKRQFMPFNTSEGRQNSPDQPEQSLQPANPVQPPQASNWLPGNGQPGTPSTQSQGIYPPTNAGFPPSWPNNPAPPPPKITKNLDPAVVQNWGNNPANPSHSNNFSSTTNNSNSLQPPFNAGMAQQQLPTMLPWVPGTTASGIAPGQGQNTQSFHSPAQPVTGRQDYQHRSSFGPPPQNRQAFGASSSQHAQPFTPPFQHGQPFGPSPNGHFGPPSFNSNGQSSGPSGLSSAQAFRRGPQAQMGQPSGSPQNGQLSGFQGQPMQGGVGAPIGTSLPPFVQPPGNNGQRQGPTSPNNKKTRKKRRFPIWARIVVGILTVLLVLVGSGAIYYQIYFASAVNSITNHTLTHHDTYTTAQKKGQPNLPQTKVNLGQAYSGGRLNILLLGSDDDQKTLLQDGMLAQTDIIVSIDPATKNITMFTIPRDSLITTPTGLLLKLDQAFLYGGGIKPDKSNAAGFVADTIQYNFGIHIDYFAWVGLTGFAKVIHTLGGVDINVLHPIVDDQYPNDTLNPNGKTDIYALKRLYLPPGPQHLDDLTALEYVRSRHADLVGDIGRGARQQQVLNQLKSKVENPDVLTKLPELMNDLKGYVQTSVPQSDMISLANLARQIDSTKINKVLLNGNYSKIVSDFAIDDGETNASVVILNCAIVQPLIDKTFNLSGHAKCNTGVDFNTGQRIPVSSSSISPITPSSPSATIPNSVLTSSTSMSASIPSHSTQSQVPSLSTMGLNGSMGFDNWFGVRSLLDMLFCVTFESGDALQI